VFATWESGSELLLKGRTRMRTDLRQSEDGSVTLTFRLTRREYEQFAREVDDKAVEERHDAARDGEGEGAKSSDAAGFLPFPPLPLGGGGRRTKKYCVSCGVEGLTSWTVTASSKLEAAAVGAVKCAPEPVTGVRQGKCRSILVSTKKKKKKKPRSNKEGPVGSGPGSRS
jgi:hypothetical protein